MKKDLLILLLLILPAFAVLLSPGYFSMHDDLQSMRQFQMDKCFAQRQIPCRWVPDLGYGFGYPLFNYYPPLPYLVGQPFRALGFQYIDIVKTVGVIGFAAAALFMYLLAKEFWGRGGALISAAFYTYAPYHSVDFYVRGAMNEFWAMAFFPAVFWTAYRLVKDRHLKWIPFVALSVTSLLLSHNPMLMIFAPALVVWCLFWVVRLKSFRSLLPLAGSALWAVGLAAFFTLPVVFESKYVSLWTLTSGYFNYLAHFLDIRQIFININWGYGSSQLGPNDTMSFAIGHLHWIVPILIVALIPFVKKLRENKFLILMLLFFVLASLFMSHSRSTPIWQAIRPLEFLQFPWRFLTLAVFSASFLSGAVASVFSSKKIIYSLILALLIILNGNYFRPREWYPDMTDAKKFSGKSWQFLVTSGIFDYLPVWAPRPPADAWGGEINFPSGQADYLLLDFRSDYQQYLVTVTTPSATAELQTYYFPGWRIWVDGVQQEIDPSRDPLLGRMQVDLTSGTHTLTARFTNTPVRGFANILSLISWVSLAILAANSLRKAWLLKTS